MRPYRYVMFHRWPNIRGKSQYGIPMDKMQCYSLHGHGDRV